MEQQGIMTAVSSNGSGEQIRVRPRRMRGIVAILFCLVCRHVVSADEVGSGRWHTDFQKAEALAKENGVPLLVHFHASWCGPCRAMEADVLSSAEVLAALKSGVVGVKVDSDSRRDLVARYGVTALPTDIIISADGKVLSKNVGSPGRSAYVARLMQFSAPVGSPPVRAAASNGLVAQAPAPGTPVTKASFEESTPPSVPVSKSEETAILALTNSATAPVVEKAASTPTESREGSRQKLSEKPLAAMTRTLRRVSDQRIGLNGYSPVSLQESEKWQTGDMQFRSDFQGVCYLLSSAEELERFNASPEKFVPALHGCDPVALVNQQVIQSGNIELGVSYQSHMYFFSTKHNRDEFLRNPAKFAGTHSLAFFQAERGNDS